VNEEIVKGIHIELSRLVKGVFSETRSLYMMKI